MKKTNKKAFTIVELVIVIAVIAILAAVLIPTFSGIIAKANESVALQEVKQAYLITLAEDMTNGDAEDQVYGHDYDIVVQHDNGTYVSISPDGEAKVVENGTPTHDLVDGKLVKNGNGGDSDNSDDTHTHAFCAICGKCTETDCDGEKCPGIHHTHTYCVTCGKCTVAECPNGETCPGHQGGNGNEGGGNTGDEHTHTACPTCGNCIAEDCTGTDDEKCLGHTDPDDPENNEPTLDLSTLQQYHCFACERTVVFYKDQIEYLMEEYGSSYNGDTVLWCPYCENASNRLVADSEVTVTINTTPVKYICYKNLTVQCTYQTSLTDLELYYKLQTGELEGTSTGDVMCPAKNGTCGSMLFSEEEYNKLPKPDLTTLKHYHCSNGCGFTVDLTQTQYQNLKNKNGVAGRCPLCISATLVSDQSAATTDCCQEFNTKYPNPYNATVTITCQQSGCTYKKEMSLADYINDFLYVTKYSFKNNKIACGNNYNHQAACKIEVTYLDE